MKLIKEFGERKSK